MPNLTAPYNLDAFNNATDFYSMTVASNELSGGYYGLFVVLITAFLIIVTMKNYDTKVVILASTAFSWLVSLLLFTPLQLISSSVFGSLSAIAIAAIVIVSINKD